jgi:hypothetical protein
MDALSYRWQFLRFSGISINQVNKERQKKD